MTCTEWTESMSAAVDGELDARTAAAVESHLARCDACSAWVQDAERLRRRLLIRVPVAIDGADVIVDEHRRSYRSAALRRRVTRVASAAAVVVLVACGLMALGQPDPSPETIETASDSFDRNDVVVQAGQTVVWVNESGVEHRLVRELGGATLEEDLEPGAIDETTFGDTGTYEFHCALHPSMAGTVTVRS